MAEARISMDEIAQYLGHRDSRVTTYVYARFSPDYLRGAANVLDLGVVQMNKLDYFLNERQVWADNYAEQLADVVWLRTPLVPEGYRHGWQAYVLYIDPDKAPMSREELMAHLHEKGISARTGTHSVHMLEFYKEQYGYKPDDFPNSLLAHNHSMAIPLHNRMSAEDYAYIIETLKSI